MFKSKKSFLRKVLQHIYDYFTNKPLKKMIITEVKNPKIIEIIKDHKDNNIEAFLFDIDGKIVHFLEIDSDIRDDLLDPILREQYEIDDKMREKLRNMKYHINKISQLSDNFEKSEK